MMPEKFSIFLDGLQCYLEGSRPLNAHGFSKVEKSDDFRCDIDEIYNLTLVKLFDKYVLKGLESICYGCAGEDGPLPAQRDHDFCLEGSARDASDAIFKKFLSKELLISVSVVGLQFWVQSNESIKFDRTCEDLMKYLTEKISDLPFDFLAVEKIRGDITNRLIDPSKLQAVENVVNYLNPSY